MGQKTTKRIKRAVTELFESGRQPKNEAENRVLVAALNAPPMIRYEKHEDQTNVPEGKVRMKPVVIRDPNPLRVAQRTALRKFSRAEQRSLLAA